MVKFKSIELSENALAVATSRYFIDGENWKTCIERVSNAISEVEGTKKLDYKNKFHEIIYNLDFLPGGRILRNAGRTKGSLFNCYVLPIEDSIESIANYYRESLILWANGAGIGANFSFLRPKGDQILGKGGKSSGLVSFLEASDATAKCIESGGQRRAAGLACVEVSHPEVLDFVDAKLVDGRLSHYNISVGITNEFLEAVELDNDWEFKFKQRSYGKIKARFIWDKILHNMINNAEPGLLNFTNLTKNNSYYYDPIVCTNPCITGETLIAVADGRIHVPIKQLVEEKKDFPVYCCDTKGKAHIRIARNPRKTGKNIKIYKVTLDDGSFVRTTENHKFILRNGEKIELKDLKVGDSLMPFNRSQYNNGKMYWNIGSKPEHTIIAEYLYGKRDSSYLVHHDDGDGLNNYWDNIEWLTRGEHNLVEPTICERKGKLNGMYDRKHTEDSKQKIRDKAIKYFEDPLNREKTSLAVKKSMTSEVRGKISKALTKERIVIKTNCRFCGNEFKQEIIKDSKNINGFCSTSCICNFAASFKEPISEKTREKISVKLKEYSNSVEGKKSRKKAAIISCIERSKKCGNVLLSLGFDVNEETWNDNRIIAKENGIKQYVLSNTISKLWNNDWDKFVEDSSNYNHKIVSIVEDGYEDVYNITVDEFHNYGIITNLNAKTRKKGYPKMTGLYIRNCGEVPLSNHSVCCLGSLNLPNFITGNINTNWIKLEKTIKLAVRFLDNVIDVNNYTLPENDIKSHESRRIGLGVLGLANYLFAKKIRYGSPESINEIERLMKFIRDCTYQASIELAVEKGAFPKFDPVQYIKSSFVRKLSVSMRMDIKNKGVRNVTLMSQAPTGTIALICDQSSGIEPLIAKAYRREDRVGSRIYINPIYEKILKEEGTTPDWFVDSYDLKPEDHLEVQSIIQKYTDGACSKTVNLPKETTGDDLSKLLLEYAKDLKGVTVYRDGSREGQILNPLTEEETLEYLNNNNKEVKRNLSEEDVQCASGTCEI